MRFALTEEQQGFARVLDDLLTAAGTPGVVRSWADGDHAPGLKLWRRLAELGLTGLLVGGEQGGAGADEVDLVVAFEALGRHAAPGPWVESVALLPALVGGGPAADARGERVADLPTDLLAPVVAGDALATVAVPGVAPYALDAGVAHHVLLLDDTVLRRATAGEGLRSIDPARRLHPLEAGAVLAPLSRPAIAVAVDTASLACAAQLLGAGERLLQEAVDHARTRRQFGRLIGEYQAVKHALADVRVGLDFTRPLVYSAALALRDRAPEAPRDVSAAKVAAGDAADAAARTALQVHGAIGYTAEHDLGLWLTRVRALVPAWGTPAWHRARVLEAVAPGRAEA